MLPHLHRGESEHMSHLSCGAARRAPHGAQPRSCSVCAAHQTVVKLGLQLSGQSQVSHVVTMTSTRDLEQSQQGGRYELTKKSPAVSDSQDTPLWLNNLEAVDQLFLFCTLPVRVH